MKLEEYQAKEQERLKWLAEIKVGDEVAIDGSRYGNAYYRLARVERVTPTLIVVGETRYHKKNGNEVGGDKWHPVNLVKPDEKVRSWVKRQSLLAAAKKINFDKLTNDQLEAILALLVTRCD